MGGVAVEILFLSGIAAEILLGSFSPPPPLATYVCKIGLTTQRLIWMTAETKYAGWGCQVGKQKIADLVELTFINVCLKFIKMLKKLKLLCRGAPCQLAH